MTYYCLKCDKDSAYTYWNRKIEKYWLACTICWKNAPPKKFKVRPDPDGDAFWQHADDRFHSYINEIKSYLYVNLYLPFRTNSLTIRSISIFNPV